MDSSIAHLENWIITRTYAEDRSESQKMDSKIGPASDENFAVVVNMAKSLRREQLFISNEQNCFVNLHKAYEEQFSRTLQVAWICARQRQVLNNLILAKPESGLSVSCLQVDLLENCYFVDIHHCKSVKYPEIIAIIELLNFLHDKPAIIAHTLFFADKSGANQVQIDTTINFVVNGLYRSAIFPKDAEMIIKILQTLIEIQIVKSDNPRRLLRSGSSSFTRLFQKYHESSFASKIFLKTILFEPIMSVLMDDDMKFEIDVQKVISVQSPAENSKMFGEEASEGYLRNVEQYRQTTIERLYKHASNFIKSFSDNWCLFPSTLRYLYKSMNHFFKPANLSKENIHIIMTDLIFTNFICPAILSPNIHGIIDAPLSDNARFNLIQIGQMIQMLALTEIQPVEEKLTDLYAKFENNCLSVLIDQLDYATFNSNFESNNETQSHNLPISTIIATYNELSTLIRLLKALNDQENMFHIEETLKLKNILDRMPHSSVTSQETKTSVDDLFFSNNTSKTKSKSEKRISKSRSLSGSPSIALNENGKEESNNHGLKIDEVVLMIPLTWNDGKLLSEAELLNNIPVNSSIAPFNDSVNVEEEHIVLNVEKKTNSDKQKTFSLPHDDASIGNTSDNLEAVSEAHSNHSVASSLELEEADQNDNDNLSDMISANVSGRGTPNISGRDTPSSQITEGGGEVQNFTTPQMTKIFNKTRSDIEDKFCKFEIKKLIEGDETISIISDTWSTDVLASDSEAMEANERNFATPLIPTTPLLPGNPCYMPITNSFGQLRLNNVDSETQSESAWSIDAALDTDENSATTRSDITDSVTVLSKDSHNSSYDYTKPLCIPECNANSNGFYRISTNENDIMHGIQSVRQNSIESSNSSSISNSERMPRYGKSDANENNINLISFESSEYMSAGISKDKNCNESSSSSAMLDSSNPFNEIHGMFSSNDNNNLNSSLAIQGLSDYNEDEFAVEHRRLSSEQRNAKFDSRRNGMIDILGTIPKSISFDSSADKMNRNESNANKLSDVSRYSESSKTNASFFSKIKLGFKNRRSTNVSKQQFNYSINGQNDSFSALSKNMMDNSFDTTEDILAKYRRKSSTSSETVPSYPVNNNHSNERIVKGEVLHKNFKEDSLNEYSIDFVGIKRKLRAVLSTTEIFSRDFEQFRTGSTSPLVIYLRVLQAQSLNNQNLQQLSGISELLRCLQSTDTEFQELLIKELQNDILIRKAYVEYLINCHHALLSAIDNIESLEEHFQMDSQLSKRQIIMLCVKIFLEKREQSLQKLHSEFVQLTVSDERKDLLNVFLQTLVSELRSDTVLKCMTEWQITEAKNCLESLLLQRLYQLVMFPNDDGDISRDQVLFQHINRLSKTITPNHAQLSISDAYLNEAPWPFAQRQLSFISAYKTAEDKVNCVIKCIKCIISLLSIGSEKVVAADDIIPVLIYVIVKVNPPHLLSTIEYVNCFIGETLLGENQYWWTQFCSAITLIKTMEYSE
ncbi:receptor-mediated endocytosis protein 6 homolog isoform X3 [Armigeres subalbatus]|uniref:receptor-mediated endocytosis protein 6 homolog isoform X3 n=1 Tax=Armigeres subalbatus TaxID=124917 RepID=UPI002ED57B25